MRRSPIILAGTLIGTVATLAFRPHTPTIGAMTTTSDTSAAPSSSAKSVAKKSGSATVTAGSAVTTQYGTTQVSVTIKSGKITDVKVLKSNLDTGEAETISINKPALPKLRAEALTAQSAKIDTVSGATYTSGAYKSSLQSALDKAGFKS